ncbi:NifU-like N terminal domain protein [Sulfurimonas hongkongensis]|uniref:NifU-like N terminal domain protein n=1 Tax=Sulfurimonas hongkongensis TaxID=1172190 RepID=T0JDU1_9BACT|nr:iron-sulfur cluster assembly scaffold protein [Sulfurimonas hongkongensis]EQB39145.1 NifU-like N terminal domain protein [Sulfurimonas hongkongensis]
MKDKEQQELETEIGRHMLQPQNYGEMQDPDCVGIGIDNATQTYAIMYLKRDSSHIQDVKFGTNSTSHDTATLGSLLSEMIKGDSIANVLVTVFGLEEDLKESYANLEKPKVDTSKPEGEQVEHISTQHQDSANIILTAFRAAMRHYDRKQEGIEEEHFEMSIVKTCPYSSGDCAFVKKAKKSDS